MSWNLVSTLIRICTVQWWCWLFLRSTKNTLFGENTQNDAEFNDAIETDVSKARQLPFLKSSESAVKKTPEVVINKYPENQYIFSKEKINAKRRHEIYTDVVQSNIKKDTRKIAMFTDSLPRGIWMRKFNQCTDGVAHLKSFPGAPSNELAHYVVPNLKKNLSIRRWYTWVSMIFWDRSKWATAAVSITKYHENCSLM